MSKIHGHNVTCGIVDEVPDFGAMVIGGKVVGWEQQELPISELTMNQHVEETGHRVLETSLPNGWFCYHYDKETEKSCTAQWPPASRVELLQEDLMAQILRTGSGSVTLVPEGVEMQISFPVIPVDRRTIEGTL